MISHEWSLSIENSKPQATNDNMHVYDKKIYEKPELTGLLPTFNKPQTFLNSWTLVVKNNTTFPRDL